MRRLFILLTTLLLILRSGVPALSWGFITTSGIQQQNINYVFEGDSITAGLFCSPPNDYPTNVYELLYQGSPTNSTKENIATSGISLATMVANYSTRAGVNFSATAALNVLAIMAGTNTSGSSDTTALQKYVLLRTYLRDAQATGYQRIVVGTVTARDDDGGTYWASTLVPLNADIRGYYNSDLRANALMDWGSDYRFSPNTAATNPAYYNTTISPVDLHPNGPPPTQLGCISMASVALGPISSVLTGSVAPYVQIPSFSIFDIPSQMTLSNSNRTTSITSGTGQYTAGGFPFAKSSKWYFEIEAVTVGNQVAVGLINESFTNFSLVFIGQATGNNSIGYFQNGNIILNNVTVATAATFTTGDTIEVAWDAGAQQVWFRRNRAGVDQNWNGSGTANPATGVGGISISAMGNGYIHPAAGTKATTDSVTSNFSAAQFVDTPPSGFSAFAP